MPAGLGSAFWWLSSNDNVPARIDHTHTHTHTLVTAAGNTLSWCGNALQLGLRMHSAQCSSIIMDAATQISLIAITVASQWWIFNTTRTTRRMSVEVLCGGLSMYYGVSRKQRKSRMCRVKSAPHNGQTKKTGPVFTAKEPPVQFWVWFERSLIATCNRRGGGGSYKHNFGFDWLWNQ